MVDVIISIVAVRLGAILEEQISSKVNLLRGMEKEVLHLSKKLETIRNVLDDAEKRGVNEQSVKNWLKKLEKLAYEMDDILDEWNYALLKHKTEHPTKQKILEEKDGFKFITSLPPIKSVPKPPRIQSTSSIELGKVHGPDIDRNKNDIVRKALMVNGDTEILSIVGMGGLGKTTLAQLVYNDTRVKNYFDLRIWICVSEPFDVAGVARGIVESVTKEIIPRDANQLESILEKLKDSISGKKFFLVLDDVWTEDYNQFELLKINLRYGAEGSKILVTTRNIRVAKMMRSLDHQIYHPEHLSDEECWSLLRRISLPGRTEEECREFEDVGKKIASKCKGLPLAANVLGSLFQFKKSLEEWENVWKSELWALRKAEVDLFPHLLLSYNELSPDLKRCFSYCASYPKDSLIHAKRLIEEWMALGYLGTVTENNEAELKGLEYFNNLAMRSLFQGFEESDDGDEQIEWCKMHDIVHDFAQFIRKHNGRVLESPRLKNCRSCDPFVVSQAKEYQSLVRDDAIPTHHFDCLTSLRVLRCKGIRFGPPQGMEKLIHLRLFELSSSLLFEGDLKIIFRLYFLQSLRLRCCTLVTIPEEIRNLVQLRHLDLGQNDKLKELPESMCSLVELRILNIEYCDDLSVLPQDINKLPNLQHLLIKGSSLSRLLPQQVAHLSGLRTLDVFCGGRDCNKLGLLKNLNRLAGTLKLEIHSSRSTNLEELAEDAREAELRNKKHIQCLHLLFKNHEEDCPSSSSSWMDVIEALEPHQNLKELRVMYYEGSRLPHWISSPLNLVQNIALLKLNEVSSLPAMGKLPFLKVLYLQELKVFNYVGREFLGIESPSSSSSSSSSSTNNHVVAFPKLTILVFDTFPQWREWEDITVEEEESAAVSIMPCLMKLAFQSCEVLKKLPHRLLRKLSPSLQILYIDESP